MIMKQFSNPKNSRKAIIVEGEQAGKYIPGYTFPTYSVELYKDDILTEIVDISTNKLYDAEEVAISHILQR